MVIEPFKPRMKASGAAVLLICADSALTRRFIAEVATAGGPRQTPLAASLAQAYTMLIQWTPRVILLDESAMNGRGGGAETLEAVVASLTEHAPVVVTGAAQHQEALTFLISAGAVDLVARVGNFAPVAAGLIARRVRLGEKAAAMCAAESAGDRDFGELLRHEVNNPLTGILGNAEMLLKHRDGLPPHTVARLETIAELAVRLRETIRRLSDCWESRPSSPQLL